MTFKFQLHIPFSTFLQIFLSFSLIPHAHFNAIMFVEECVTIVFIILIYPLSFCSIYSTPMPEKHLQLVNCIVETFLIHVKPNYLAQPLSGWFWSRHLCHLIRRDMQCVFPLSPSLFLYVSLPHGLYFTDSLHNERLPLTRGSRIHWRRHFWIAIKSRAIFGSSRKSGRSRQRLSFIYQSQEESVHSGRKSSPVRGFKGMIEQIFDGIYTVLCSTVWCKRRMLAVSCRYNKLACPHGLQSPRPRALQLPQSWSELKLIIVSSFRWGFFPSFFMSRLQLKTEKQTKALEIYR